MTVAQFLMQQLGKPEFAQMHTVDKMDYEDMCVLAAEIRIRLAKLDVSPYKIINTDQLDKSWLER